MLSDNESETQRLAACNSGPLHFSAAVRFARAIEAEVRKQDTELIRQMLGALVISYPALNTDGLRKAVLQAIALAKTRLEIK